LPPIEQIGALLDIRILRDRRTLSVPRPSPLNESGVTR
jgi:hypothetical protein